MNECISEQVSEYVKQLICINRSLSDCEIKDHELEKTWIYLVKVSRSVVSDSLQPHGLYSPWKSPGQNTGVGSLSFLQRIFPIQGLNPGLPHCRWILYQLSRQGSPKILQWVTYPFSIGSSWPRNQPRVSCIAGGFFISWATREAPLKKRTSPGRGPGVGICHRNTGKNDGGLVLVMLLGWGGWILAYLEIELAGFAEMLDVRWGCVCVCVCVCVCMTTEKDE